MPICNASANTILNQVFYGTKYVALLSGDPTGTGSFTTELVGASYERKAVVFSTSSNRSLSNSGVLWWADLPNTPIRYIAVCTAATGGSMVAYKATGVDIYVEEGKRFVIAIGDLAFSLTDS